MRPETDPIRYPYPFALTPWPLKLRVVEYWTYLSLDPAHHPMSREFACVTARDYDNKTEREN